jgi:DNA-binding response OmpR family regulator
MIKEDLTMHKKRSTGILQIDKVTLDVEKSVLTGPNGKYNLTPMESRLLRTFMLNSGRVMPRSFLMKTVWGTDWVDDCRTLEVHVCWLRKKMGDSLRRPQYLRTIRGVGYKFEPNSTS